jgi:hypothetical protein
MVHALLSGSTGALVHHVIWATIAIAVTVSATLHVVGASIALPASLSTALSATGDELLFGSRLGSRLWAIQRAIHGAILGT